MAKRVLIVKKRDEGFTLIELILVIIILGILSISVIPKLSSSSSIEQKTIQDQLISRLHLIQMEALNSNDCSWLVVDSDCFYIERNKKSHGICPLPSKKADCSNTNDNKYKSVKFSKMMLKPQNYRFDTEGKLTDSSLKKIAIYGDQNLKVEINSQGYIHE